LRAAEQERADVARARETWWTDPDGGVGGIGPERLVSLDECGVLTDMARLHGRSPRGTRACASAPFGRWTRVTVLGALGHGGIVGAMSVEAATGAAVFHACREGVLLPELRRAKPEAVLVMDNPPAHKAPRVRALLDRSGFAYRCLPAYSPDPNPIEPAWAKVEAELRRIGARTVDAPHEALGPALGAITPQHAAGFFRHSGYSRPD
jgi:DDE superfamily endonuclease